jgi:PAS domain S-box-containing protein
MPTFHFTKRIFVISIFCALFVVMAAGWVFTGYLVEMATRIVERELENANAVISINLTSELKRIESAATAIAGSPLTLPLLQANTPENMEKVNNILDRYHKSLEAAACYLIDKNGLTLASSNRNEKDSFVGQNYTFRPYFQQAIKGGIGYLFAYGTVSKRRGFYASSPVRDKEGQIVGVVTIKKEIEDIETKLSQYSWFLVDQSGIIFMSSQPEARLKSLWPLSDEQQQKIILSKQYGPGPFEPVLQKPLKDKTEVTFHGGQYLASQHATPYEGISVVLLWPTGQISMYRSFGIMLTLLALLLTLSFLAVIYIFQRSNFRMKQLLEESQTQALALADSEGQLRAQTDELESQKETLLEQRRELEESKETLAQAEERNRLILGSIGEGIFGVDKESRITFLNPAASAILGYTEEEMLGEHLHDRVHYAYPDGSEFPQLQCSMYLSSQDGKARTVDNEVFWRKDGTAVSVEYSTTPVWKDDKVVGTVVSFRDITERREAEEQVNAYFNNSSDGLLILSPERGFIHANQTAAAMFGFESIADLIKCGPVELSPPYQPDGRPSQEAAMEYITKAMQMDVPLRFDWIHRRTDGTDFPCEIALFKIVLAGQQHLITNIRDITERKVMNEKLRHANFLSDQALDLSQAGYWHIPLNTGDEYYNSSERAATIFGDPPREDWRYHLMNEWFANVEAGDKAAAEATMENYNAALAGSVPGYDAIYAYKRPIDGRVVWIHAMGHVVRDSNGTPTDMYGVTMDITDRKRSERELIERMEELERFSHLTINREEKMIQLKEEINLLLEQTGREKKYKIVEE